MGTHSTTPPQDFLVWLNQASFPPHPLTPPRFQDGTRGLVATKAIQAGEPLVVIPSTLLLTKDRVLSILPINAHTIASSIPAQALLGAYIAMKKFKKDVSGGEWGPYIHLLPNDYPTIPLLYPASLMPLLPHAILQKVKEQKRLVDEAYIMVLQIPGWDTLTEDEFKWGWLTVNTRCIYLDQGGREKEDRLAVAPFLDIPPHDPTTSVTGGMNHTKDAYPPHTHRSIQMGEQYGFTSWPGNPHQSYQLEDTLVFDLLPPLSPSDREDRLRTLRESPFYGDYSLHSGEMSYRLEITLYLWALLPGPDYPVSLALWQDLVNGMVEEEALGKGVMRRMRVLAHQVADLITSQATARLSSLKAANSSHENPEVCACLTSIWSEAKEIAQSIYEAYPLIPPQ
ncbi:MAG: hypothetical protein DHS80DRAFT_28747 [Piptocephalis tieghemiana]|nr:MAG: hypothetical protein DHS80DRAFT_28747 [Piptocephalis tieghemiana]